ncbi:hypothetical protein A3306_06080 [Rickettsia bellii]|nr:hypothetical protein A3306_06080 [Rickettsia bellii]
MILKINNAYSILTPFLFSSYIEILEITRDIIVGWGLGVIARRRSRRTWQSQESKFHEIATLTLFARNDTF